MPIGVEGYLAIDTYRILSPSKAITLLMKTVVGSFGDLQKKGDSLYIFSPNRRIGFRVGFFLLLIFLKNKT
jgi:hypothetical protein